MPATSKSLKRADGEHVLAGLEQEPQIVFREHPPITPLPDQIAVEVNLIGVVGGDAEPRGDHGRFVRNRESTHEPAFLAILHTLSPDPVADKRDRIDHREIASARPARPPSRSMAANRRNGKLPMGWKSGVLTLLPCVDIAGRTSPKHLRPSSPQRFCSRNKIVWNER